MPLPVAYDGFGVGVYSMVSTTGDPLETRITFDILLDPKECAELAAIAGQRHAALLAVAAQQLQA